MGPDDQIGGINFYKKNGFFVAKKIVPHDAIENCKASVCRIASQPPENGLEDSLKNIFRVSQERYLQVLRTFSKSLDLQSLFLHPKLVDLIRNFGIQLPTMPTQPVTHVTCKELITDDGQLGLDAHQDWPSIQGSLDSLVVWIPITKVTNDNHPMQILPGSHLGGLRQAKIEKNISSLELEKKELDSMLDICCDPGDAIIFSTMTVHRTKKEGNGFRFSASLRFDNALENSFVDRNFPCAYKRTIDRNVSYFPRKEQMLKIFGE